MYLSSWIVLISIIIYLISNSLLNFIFSKRSNDQYEELFVSGENLDDSLIEFQKNHEKNRFLGLRNVPDYILSYILSRNDQHQAIKLYNIARDYIYYNKESNTVEVKGRSQYIFDKNEFGNSGLTIKEKSIAAYTFWSILSVLLMFYFSREYGSDICNYYKEFIF
uniref:hypothetical protein n=1 Tax=Acinetobacter guillouiae TaxID=106649 RepID=UPI0012506F10